MTQFGKYSNVLRQTRGNLSLWLPPALACVRRQQGRRLDRQRQLREATRQRCDTNGIRVASAVLQNDEVVAGTANVVKNTAS